MALKYLLGKIFLLQCPEIIIQTLIYLIQGKPTWAELEKDLKKIANGFFNDKESCL